MIILILIWCTKSRHTTTMMERTMTIFAWMILVTLALTLVDTSLFVPAVLARSHRLSCRATATASVKSFWRGSQRRTPTRAPRPSTWHKVQVRVCSALAPILSLIALAQLFFLERWIDFSAVADHRSIDELLSFIEGSKPGKKKEKAKPKEIEPSAKNATFSSPATPAVNLDKQKDTSPGKAALTGTPAPLQSQVAVSSPTPSPAAKASTSPPIATATVPAARAGARPDPSSTVSQQLDVKDTSSLQNETSSQNKTPPKESPVVVTEKPKSKRQLKKLQQQQQRQTAASLMQEMLEVDSVEKVFAPMDDLSLVTDESDRELELFKQFCSFNSPVRLRIPVKFSQDARFALDYTVSSGVSMKATSQICGLT
eukprot:m.627538 g.627538  ORF g.627538 m.627538 type:complete len:370 (-) comp58254_c0_seq19:946-2055(-)